MTNDVTDVSYHTLAHTWIPRRIKYNITHLHFYDMSAVTTCRDNLFHLITDRFCFRLFIFSFKTSIFLFFQFLFLCWFLLSFKNSFSHFLLCFTLIIKSVLKCLSVNYRNYLGIYLCWLSFTLRLCHFFIFLYLKSNIWLYPGHCKWYIVEILDPEHFNFCYYFRKLLLFLDSKCKLCIFDSISSLPSFYWAEILGFSPMLTCFKESPRCLGRVYT